MKTGKKIGRLLLLVIAAFLAAILIFAVISVIFVAATNDGDKTPDEFTMAWQSYIDDDTLMREMVMPGSHDSGTDTMNWMGRTQYMSIEEQLKCGARYFDIRVQKTDKGLVYFHGPLKCGTFPPVLTMFMDFLEEHPSESLILDFQHFKNDSPEEVLALIKTILGIDNNRYLVTNDTDTDDVTFINNLKLGDARGKCIIIWSSAFPENYTESCLFSRSEVGNEPACLYSYYDSALHRKGSLQFMKKAVPTHIAEARRDNSGLFVLQLQLTSQVFLLGPHFSECTHYKRVSKYLSSLPESEDLPIINIVLRDFINSTKCKEIIALNYHKNTVKDELKEEFLQKVK